MKYVLVFLLFFPVTPLANNSAITLSLSSFNNPYNSLTMGAIWRYKQGDSSHFSKPLYNDNHWKKDQNSILFGKEINRLAFDGIAWFRATIKADLSTVNKPLSFTIRQTCASEIFLDGHKIFSVGSVGTSERDEKCEITFGTMNLFPVTLHDTSNHILAIRYSYHGYKRSKRDMYPAGFMFHMGIFDEVRKFLGERLITQSAIRWFFTGIPLAFALLHILLAIFYPRVRANFYYALFTISAATLTYSIMGSWFNDNIQAFIFQMWLFKISLLLLFPSSVFFLYASFYRAPPKHSRIILAISIIALLCSWFLSLKIVYIIGMFMFFEEIRVIVVAVKNAKKGATIISCGFIICMLGCAYQMLIPFEIVPIPEGLFQFPYLWGFLGMMISMSLYLAKDITDTNKQLEKVTIQQKNTILHLETEMAERHKAEQLAKRQYEKLIQADKLASIGTLVSGVGHEINNPNNYMLLNSDNLADIWKGLRPVLDRVLSEYGDFEVVGMPYSEIREEIPTLIKGISEGSERIRTIVQNLKDFARKDPGDLNQRVDIMQVVNSSKIILANLIKNTTNFFTINAPDILPAIKGNAQQIEQVLINILSNACHALPDKSKRITIIITNEDKKLRVVIKDEGKGILPNQMQHIMDPFFTTKRDSGGTGLGLSISYNIIKAHKGTFDIQSKQDIGSTVTITLPIWEESSQK